MVGSAPVATTYLSASRGEPDMAPLTYVAPQQATAFASISAKSTAK